MVQTFYSCFFILLFISTLTQSQDIDKRNLNHQFQNHLNSEFQSEPDQTLINSNIQRNSDSRNHANNVDQIFTKVSNHLNNEIQNNDRGYFQNDIKNNQKDSAEKEAQSIIEKLEKILNQYQKLKQVQDDLQKRIIKLEKTVSASNLSSHHQDEHETNESMKQKFPSKVSNQMIEQNEKSIQKNNFSQNPSNWQQNKNPSLHDENLGYQLQKPNGFAQNNRLTNSIIRPTNEVGNFLNMQSVIPQAANNDIFNNQQFAQTQNIIRNEVQQLPYFGRRLYETQIQNPIRYQIY